jgi:tRNA (guanine-N7-)-methyltransferase
MTNIQDISIKQFKHKIDKIFINFPDPWPKKRHEKRRLTSLSFINIYKQFLKDDGLIELKTDNENLYYWTINNLSSRKDCKIIYQTTNLYAELNNNFNKNNIQTEYEMKFVSQQKRINKIIWKFL